MLQNSFKLLIRSSLTLSLIFADFQKSQRITETRGMLLKVYAHSLRNARVVKASPWLHHTCNTYYTCNHIEKCNPERLSNIHLFHILADELEFSAIAVLHVRSSRTGSVHGERANFTGLVLGCIEADLYR